MLTYQTSSCAGGLDPTLNIPYGLFIGVLIPFVLGIVIGKYEQKKKQQFVDPLHVVVVWNISSMLLLFIFYILVYSLGSSNLSGYSSLSGNFLTFNNSIFDSVLVGFLAGMISFLFLGWLYLSEPILISEINGII